MSNDLVVVEQGRAVATRTLDGTRLIERWIAGRKPETIKAYQAGLRVFADYWFAHVSGDAATPGEAIEALLRLDHGQANETGLAYRAHLLESGLAPATVNQRLAALRSIVNVARVVGFISWALEVDDVKSEAYRDTRGPELADITRVLALAGMHPNKGKAARDVAIVMLMFGNGLRVSEVTELDVAHFDAHARRLSILGKGRREREPVTLPQPTIKALKTWLGRRGREPGALFRSYSKHGALLGRISRDGIEDMMTRWGEQLGFVLRPHGLRHAFVTQVLNQTNGNLRMARQAARHKKIDVTIRYDDNRADLAGDAAKLVADLAAATIDKLSEGESDDD